MNRKQRRAEEKSTKGAPLKQAPGLLEQTLFRQAWDHHRAGRLREAEAGYRDTLAVNARHPGALSFLGLLAHQSGHSAAGIDLLKKAIAADKQNPELHYNLARVFSDCGRDNEAILHNRKALDIKPDYAEAHNNLGTLLLMQGRHADALAALIQGLQVVTSTSLKSALVMAVQSLDPNKIFIEPKLIQLLTRALDEPWCRPRDLSHAAGSILLRSRSMARSIGLVQQAGPHRPDELFSSEDLTSIENEGLLSALLSTSPVTTVALERVLTATRRALLNEVSSGSNVLPDQWLLFASAIAQQCFINEYVFDTADPEMAQVDQLRDAIADAVKSEEPVEPVKIALLASYLPLHSIAGSERLAARSWPEPAQLLIVQQIENYREEQSIRPGIERLTTVSAGVSEKVREQYEENPYPRWTKLFADNQPIPIDQYVQTRFPGASYKGLGNGSLEMLIAGCGTGMHAIQRALRFKSANVLAIDLSLSSLSYAVRKTNELGLTNLRYAQADILALESDKTFDVIDSSGVLHHLENPLEGWRKLAGMVRPGGLMHIGLYSAIARRDVAAARESLAKQRRDYSISRVRELRTQVENLTPDDPLNKMTQFSDFFSMSECRDLLFHVQEHQFTIPEISNFLAEAGFTFIGFETSARGAYLRRFPDDPAATHLANWNTFELENPSLFAQMYQFWIQKN